PDDATLRARIRELEAGGADLQSQAARPAEPAPRPVPAPRPFEAAADEADEGGPAPAEGESIREYFESLLAWEPRDEP
ncbi:MAG TPA: hypothetical protein VFQ22_02180, partial [Longimicrobiales bacterium]|nr:hypothetical protein [Longimicrobiales bacterium]